MPLYFQLLALAETSTLAGQFQTGKVLRLVAQSLYQLLQREGRRDCETGQGPQILRQALQLIEQKASPQESAELLKIAHKTLASLDGETFDVGFDQVADRIFLCFNCLNILTENEITGDCKVCGAVGFKAAAFNPFFSQTKENLLLRSGEFLVAELESMPERLAQTLVQAATKKPRTVYPIGTDAEIIGHMMDVVDLCHERVDALTRESTSIPEARATLPWVESTKKGYKDSSVNDVLQGFTRSMAVLFRNHAQTPNLSQWARKGVVGGSVSSVYEQLCWVVNHNIGHLNQIIFRYGLKPYLPQDGSQ